MPSIKKKHGTAFKAKVALEAIKGMKTLSQIAREYSIHPLQVSKWKKKLLDNAKDLFEDGRIAKTQPESEQLIKELYEQIGMLKVENDFLKKKSGIN